MCRESTHYEPESILAEVPTEQRLLEFVLSSASWAVENHHAQVFIHRVLRINSQLCRTFFAFQIFSFPPY